MTGRIKDGGPVGDFARDMRHLIYADLQFEHRGETDLKWGEVEALIARGWMVQKYDGELSITDAGRAAIEAALAAQGQGDAVAWYVLRVAPGRSDDGMRLGPFFRRSDAETWADEHNVIMPLYGSSAPPAGVPDGWKRPAALWLIAKADEQRATNAKYPRHAECYPAWGAFVTKFEMLASELLAAAPSAPSEAKS